MTPLTEYRDNAPARGDDPASIAPHVAALRPGQPLSSLPAGTECIVIIDDGCGPEGFDRAVDLLREADEDDVLLAPPVTDRVGERSRRHCVRAMVERTVLGVGGKRSLVIETPVPDAWLDLARQVKF